MNKNNNETENKKEQTYKKSPGFPGAFRWLALVISVIIFFTVYEVCVVYDFRPIVIIYGILFGAFLLAYGVVNRGFSRQAPLLPEGMDEDEKTEYLIKQSKRDKIAKMLLYPVISILVTFAFDLIGMFFG